MHERMRRGALAEALAAGYLEERLGWTVLARNVRYRCGELDVVAWDGGVLVVVEVRSRFGAGGPRPEDTVTWPKQRRLLRAARRFVQERRLGSASVRFDVVAVDGQRRRVRAHYRGAFGEGDAAP